MGGNTFGTLFRITTFGESHGPALGVVIDGCPSGIPFDIERLQKALDRRKPGKKNADGTINQAVTSRSENDAAEVLSGVFEGKTTGTSIAVLIRNTSQHSADYSNIKDIFRPGHADYTYSAKYGFRDYRGGGRSSGRETAARVAAGAAAQMVFDHLYPGVSVCAYTTEAAGIQCTERDLSSIEKNDMRACDAAAAQKMIEKIDLLRREGNSAGGIIECVVKDVPAGLGEPVFDKLDALLSAAVMSIGAVKGIEFGAGFESAAMTGSEWNDVMYTELDSSEPRFKTNHAGGILGGISNGNDIVFRAAVKPVPSILREQHTITVSGENTAVTIHGRHDICLCPRIVPVIEAMTWCVLADTALRQRAAENR